MSNTDNRSKFYTILSDIYNLRCIAALLDWDQQVYMPPRGAKARSEQLEYVELLIHHKLSDVEFVRIVDELHDSMDTLSGEDQVNVRETKRLLDRLNKLPADFVAEKTRVCSLSYTNWVKARPNNDFESVKPYLEKIVELTRQECDLIGYDAHPYDALLDKYEPGMKIAVVKPLLLDLAGELRSMLPAISGLFANHNKLNGQYDLTVQYKLSRRIAQDLGYDFETGRLDRTAHPFMTTIGPLDARITTRFDETDFLNALYSTIHETGHALYELGLLPEHAGTPMGCAVSMGIHESQSRIWENVIGRSREFSVYLNRILAELFPDEANKLNPQDLWMYANHVKPNLIRVDADEVTYSQHIVIRMLLEEALVAGELSVTDLPGAWSDLYEQYLGIRPTDYKDGVMQDVHWYSGAIGYFPSYALGNLYNSMMTENARKTIPDLYQQVERGDFSVLLSWLRENVHRHGMRYRAPELINRISGQELSAEPFIKYLKNKFLQS